MNDEDYLKDPNCGPSIIKASEEKSNIQKLDVYSIIGVVTGITSGSSLVAAFFPALENSKTTLIIVSVIFLGLTFISIVVHNILGKKVYNSVINVGSQICGVPPDKFKDLVDKSRIRS